MVFKHAFSPKGEEGGLEGNEEDSYARLFLSAGAPCSSKV